MGVVRLRPQPKAYPGMHEKQGVSCAREHHVHDDCLRRYGPDASSYIHGSAMNCDRLAINPKEH